MDMHVSVSACVCADCPGLHHLGAEVIAGSKTAADLVCHLLANSRPRLQRPQRLLTVYVHVGVSVCLQVVHVYITKENKSLSAARLQLAWFGCLLPGHSQSRLTHQVTEQRQLTIYMELCIEPTSSRWKREVCVCECVCDCVYVCVCVCMCVCV